jgi:isopentenyl diphosphate isomerase/L-lactate dehydrogenase-like FMN-dependent dehydrogenase
VQKAEASGYLALCVTADSIGASRRDRDLHNRYLPRDGTLHPNLPPGDVDGGYYQIRFTWDDFAWLKSITRLPIMAKGITTIEDALQSIECGASAVYVSNHSGRELDHMPATLEVLPEIIDAVGGRAEVVVDGGFLRGTDVVKAIALGARGVLLGKLQVWGLAAGGEETLERTLEILDYEIADTLKCLGCPSISALDRSYLRPSTPTRFAAYDWNQYEWAPLPKL